jgi:hypothetical protein
MPRPDAFDFLTGALSDQPIPSAVGPAGHAKKFLPDGRVLPWAGNTFICHVPRPSPVFDAICAIQDALKASALAPAYTFLPPASFHMTVFQGVSPTLTGFEELPTGADPSMDRDAVTGHMKAQTDGLDLPRQFTMRLHEVYAGLGLTLTAADDPTDTALRTTRETLRAATGITHAANFETYTFHVTLAYLLKWLTPEDARAMQTLCADLTAQHAPALAQIPLGPLEFCTFDDMHHFEPVRVFA